MMGRTARTTSLLFSLALSLALSSCDRSAPNAESEPAKRVEPDQSTLQALDAATKKAWKEGGQCLQQALEAAAELHRTIDDFLNRPSDKALQQVRTSWQKTHAPYFAFGLFLHFTDGYPALFAELGAMNSTIDAWPITPGYLDRYDVYTHSGIVNDLTVPITATAIREQHGFSDRSDVSLGFHAIAYLLWGEDGQRPIADFDAAASPPSHTNAADQPQHRRRTLLALLSTLLTDDLSQLARTWYEPGRALPSRYQSLSAASRLRLLQTASVQFIEQSLLTEHVYTLAEAAEQTPPAPEQIHSLFADRGASAIASAAALLQAVWLDGAEPGLARHLASASASAYQELERQFNELDTLLSQHANDSPLIAQTLQSLATALQAIALQLRPSDHYSPDSAINLRYPSSSSAASNSLISATSILKNQPSS